MHTPRFSGQPASAGDFVFIRTASRPILTSCENVGTVVPLSRARIFAALARRAHKIARAQSSAERSTANPEIPPARNSVRSPRSRTTLLALVRRGLLGFAGLAPHSGRSSVPFRLTCSGTEDNSLPTPRLQTSWSRPTQGKCFPDKHRSIGNKRHPVKSFATFAQLYLWKSITWHHSCPVQAPSWNDPT